MFLFQDTPGGSINPKDFWMENCNLNERYLWLNNQDIEPLWLEEMLLQRNLRIVAYHVPGQTLVNVDGASRGKVIEKLVSTELQLHLANRFGSPSLPRLLSINQITQLCSCLKGTVTIVTPVWPSQPWWPRILALAVALPLWIPFHPGNIIVPSDNSKVARVRIRFDLVGWSISNNSAKRKAFRGRGLSSRRPAQGWRTDLPYSMAALAGLPCNKPHE